MGGIRGEGCSVEYIEGRVHIECAKITNLFTLPSNFDWHAIPDLEVVLVVVRERELGGMLGQSPAAIGKTRNDCNVG